MTGITIPPLANFHVCPQAPHCAWPDRREQILGSLLPPTLPLRLSFPSLSVPTPTPARPRSKSGSQGDSDGKGILNGGTPIWANHQSCTNFGANDKKSCFTVSIPHGCSGGAAPWIGHGRSEAWSLQSPLLLPVATSPSRRFTKVFSFYQWSEWEAVWFWCQNCKKMCK